MKKSNKTIISYIPDFLDWIDIERGLSNKTQENYDRFLRKFSKWLKENNLEDLKPHQLESEHVWNYRVFLARSSGNGRILKKTTQNYYLIALRAFLNFFAARDIEALPAEKVELAKQKKDKKVEFLKLEEVEKLLHAPDVSTFVGIRDRAIMEILFSTGLRVNELVSLNRKQFKNNKFENGTIELSIIGKGGYPRIVYFSERCVVWLQKYLNIRDALMGPGAIDDSLLINFRGAQKSKRLSARSVENIIKKYAIQSGLSPGTTPHTLRHSFATDLLNQGADLRTVQEFLGHQNIATTQIYTHVTNKRLKDLHQRFHGGKKIKD